jgi:4-alpha-glucanotransferase
MTHFSRSSGVLLHITSLPGPYGIGSMGRHAKAFIDFLAESGFHFWQMCPIGPTGFGDSPYQTFSAFAGNPYLIDLEALANMQLLELEDLKTLEKLPKHRVDFGALYESFWPILQKAHARFKAYPSSKKKAFEAYKAKEAAWLEPYSAFMALKHHFKGQSWQTWPKGLHSYAQFQTNALKETLLASIEPWQFYQYLFDLQWQELHTYAHSKGIELIGDIPIFVASDSADLWTHPKFFDTNQEGLPQSQAGVPPDYFSEKGQLWGNPLYNWDALKTNGYDWWKARLGRMFHWFDAVRIDHFRAFDSYWKVEVGAKDAIKGKWKKGPGMPFFDAIFKHFESQSIPCKLIAEDLGDINDSVRRLLKETQLPGMAVLQFGFGGDADNMHLPHNHQANQVLYPGTHDNDTFRGWYEHADFKTQDHIRNYFGISGDAIAWDGIRATFKSVANVVIIPLQDLLNLGSEARMNQPGVPEGNWSWRYETQSLQNLLNHETKAYLKKLHALYGREVVRTSSN